MTGYLIQDQEERVNIGRSCGRGKKTLNEYKKIRQPLAALQYLSG
jgi:hypothetical protein